MENNTKFCIFDDLSRVSVVCYRVGRSRVYGSVEISKPADTPWLRGYSKANFIAPPLSGRLKDGGPLAWRCQAQSTRFVYSLEQVAVQPE